MDSLLTLASVAALSYSLCYVISCAAFPFGRCRRSRCENGRIHSRLSRKVFRHCPRCEGTGRRVRIGRRVYEYLRAEHKEGNR